MSDLETEFQKHRDEKRVFEIDFSNDLANGETLTGTPAVKIVTYVGTTETDVSSQFGPSGDLNESLATPKVQFTVIAATQAADQADGVYYVHCEVGTSSSQTLIAVPLGTIPLPRLRVRSFPE